MMDPLNALTGAIAAIQEQQGYPKVAVRPELHLVRDLGLTSLDIAQLVAMMEGDIGFDPFANGATLDQVTTVEAMARLYVRKAS